MFAGAAAKPDEHTRIYASVRNAAPDFSEALSSDAKGSLRSARPLSAIPADSVFGVELNIPLRDQANRRLLTDPGMCPASVEVIPSASLKTIVE